MDYTLNASPANYETNRDESQKSCLNTERWLMLITIVSAIVASSGYKNHKAVYSVMIIAKSALNLNQQTV